MSADQRPVVAAFDGSEEAQAAVRAAATLFAGRKLLVVTVWEPGLAVAMTTTSDLSGLTSMSPSPEQMATMDRAQRDHALITADAGAELARECGAVAEPHPVPDDADIPGTIAAVADAADACAVVVGSRGLGRIKSRLLGSTSQGLLHRTERPVMVVRAPR